MNMKNFILVTIVIFTLVCGNDWVQEPAMITARSDMTATVVGDFIIVAGGCSANQVCPPGPDTFCFCEEVTNRTEAFNPVTKEWKTLAKMPHQRYRHAAVAYGSKLYVFGGRDLADNIIQDVDVYDSALDSWTTLTERWLNATSDLTAVMIRNTIYASGGYTYDYGAVTSTATYDILAGGATWKYGTVSQLNVARGDCCSVYVDGKIWIFGGFNFTNFCNALDTLEVYDPSLNQWDIKQPLHFPRGDSACAVLHDKFHAIAGEKKDKVEGCSKYDIPINDVEVYDPSTNSWTEETPIPESRFRFAAATFNNVVYLFGGQGSPYNNTVDTIYPVLSSVLSFNDTIATPDSSLANHLHFGYTLLTVLCGLFLW